MAAAGGGWVLQLPRRADQQPCSLGVPAPHDDTLATGAAAAEPEGPPVVGPDQSAGGRVAPQAENPSSVAERALRRQTPEVGAVCGKAARTVLCGGRPVMGVPTAIVAKPRHDDGSTGTSSNPSSGITALVNDASWTIGRSSALSDFLINLPQSCSLFRNSMTSPFG